MALPFLLLLCAIAFGPLWAPRGWNRHYPKVALGLGALTVAYYAIHLQAWTPLEHTAHEYFSFIVLIGSLFVVAGGIHITVQGEATPLANTVFLLLGAVIANLLGTTGAAMLLIRPWLRMNRYRLTTHHVVFFIFLVANVGGCLTPIGDPPLFLGYLRGVPFWWVAAHCWPMWLVGVGTLLLFFYALDRRNYLRAPAEVRQALAEPKDTWRFEGLGNLAVLAVILAAVFIKHPPLLRESIMIAAAVVSHRFTRREIHRANEFNFHPIREVAILFAGIFATMIPALQWLQANASRLGEPSLTFFFWATGSLSSLLDNAPTYLSFLSTATGALIPPEFVRETLAAATTTAASAFPPPIAAALDGVRQIFPDALRNATLSTAQIEMACLLTNPALNPNLVAISVGAVFFGANTYIGNGPNFMVKAIADQQKVRMPTFLGYVARYAVPFMLPMLILVWALFFR